MRAAWAEFMIDGILFPPRCRTDLMPRESSCSPARLAMSRTFHVSLFGLLLVGLSAHLALAVAPEEAKKDGSAAATQAMATFRMPKGLTAQLFAAEPQIGNPVAISVDEQGRIFVAEEYRFNRGTEENRTRPFLLEDDLQLQTVEDRLAMYQKFAGKFEGGMDWFTKAADQVRLLEDRDGDGRADVDKIFAGGFNGPLDGLAAGVMATSGDVYFTCIPNLWLLRDTDGDGEADVRKVIHTGFGVNAAFLGHDLHGLCWGPDGRLYFSIGDRGFHVTTKEGKLLHGPRTGAVFRCEPDGANLEVVHRGLRNPQELAFDNYGNLFADDNNCDKGDRARLVYIVEGGDSGWNMSNQTLAAPYLTGPWHAEKIWHLPDKQQPAWIVPTAGHLGAGPSGFAHYPGLGLPERYADHFFMCNYTGQNGGVEAFAVEPVGAGYTIVDYHDFMKPLASTDIEFGYDGKIHVSTLPTLDWTGAASTGRLYTVHDAERIKDERIQQVARLMREGIEKRSVEELAALLDHPDQRVRQRAQFALAARGIGSIKVFSKLTAAADKPVARRHAIWGLWQIGRKHVEALPPVAALLGDPDAEIRAQAAKVIGDCRWPGSNDQLMTLVSDPNPRVRFFATIALGRLKHRPAIEPIFTMLRDNKNEDAYLRHAGFLALAEFGDADAVLAKSKDPDMAVRLAVVLVLRRLMDARIVRFLDDADMNVVTEAARAINDLAMDEAQPALAAHLSRGSNAPEHEPFVRRAINAQFRQGKAENAQALASLVADVRQSLPMRSEALAALSDWTKPSPRDRVTGFWRPLEPRSPELIRGVLEHSVAQMLSRTSGDLQSAAIKLIIKLDIKTDDDTFFVWTQDRERSTNTRIEALRLLAARKYGKLADAVNTSLADNSPLLRAEARQVLASYDSDQAMLLIDTVLADSSSPVVERQRGLETLAGMKDAGSILTKWGERLLFGSVPDELQLDVWEALAERPEKNLLDMVTKFKATMLKLPERQAKFSVSLVGGDAERGKVIFTGHSTAQCVRCHKVRGEGGAAGPDLSEVAKRGQRDYLLQSMIDPNAKIAQGYASVTLVLDTGKLVAGVLKNETAHAVTIETPDGKQVVVPTAEIDERTMPTSSMPNMERALTPREVRDLVEYLSTLK